MCTMRWGGGQTARITALTVNRTTGQNFYGTECGWRRRAGRREQAACISTGTRGVMNRWRGWIRQARGPNRILYFHTDVNGAPEEMTDSDGKIVWERGIRSGVTRYRRRTTAGWSRTCATRDSTSTGKRGCTTICTGTMIRMSGGSW